MREPSFRQSFKLRDSHFGATGFELNSSLGEKTPNEFAKEIAASRDFLGLQTAENSP
jgi:hypothetical protein